ncbi:MAG: sodium:proton antiporter [Planctomycetota bacterium]
MTLLTCILVGVIFAASFYLLTGRELKGICMGMFLLGHGANLAILSVSGSPLGKTTPVLGEYGKLAGTEADPLPQALILTAIVIGFAVQAFALTMLVVTYRRGGSSRLMELERKAEADK